MSVSDQLLSVPMVDRQKLRQFLILYVGSCQRLLELLDELEAIEAEIERANAVGNEAWRDIELGFCQLKISSVLTELQAIALPLFQSLGFRALL